MNEPNTQLPQGDVSRPVQVDAETVERLTQIGEQLKEEGKVLVQTSEDVGQNPPTVH